MRRPDGFTYYETRSTDPAYNLAFEEYILQNKTEGDILILWQNDNAIIVGQNQNTEAEIDQSYVDAHGIKVIRRMTGGGAVYHDLGNLNYSFITDIKDKEKLSMKQFTDPVIEVLSKLGVKAHASGRNDILIEDKKISGTAQHIEGNRILHHGTLLFDADVKIMQEALRTDHLKYVYSGTKSVESRVGNISDYLPVDFTMQQFWNYLKHAFGVTDLEKLQDEELSRIIKIKEEKYDKWEWNYGHSPLCQIHNKKKWNGGILEINLDVKCGEIQRIFFKGDFLSLRDLSGLERDWIGCKYNQKSCLDFLSKYPVHEYFGTITREEIIQTMF